MASSHPSRRDWLTLCAAGAVSGWFADLARSAAAHPKRKRSCILLWMPGGPSQMDTFDLKPGQKTGGPFKDVATSAPGVRISEHLPKVAGQMKHLAVIRSMSTREGDHDRAAYLLRTGNLPQEPVQYPTLGSLFARELGDPGAELPAFVSVGTARGLNDGGFGAGFLGPDYAPLLVGNSDTDPYTPLLTEKALRVPDLKSPAKVSPSRGRKRIGLLDAFNSDFTARHDGLAVSSLASAYKRALRLTTGTAAKAFDLDQEKPGTRDSYGRTLFGQGCLLARRLVERGVPFVEVALGRVPGAFAGWDTHQRNFDSLKALCGVLDPAWGALTADLHDRGLLETTTIVWMGEFGRTPRINPQAGRDHYPNAWSVVLGGGGIKGGQVIGKTSADGAEVKERPVAVPDLLATVCKALGIDPTKQNLSNIGRPIRIVDRSGKPVTEALA
jgi:hypothetical protein